MKNYPKNSLIIFMLFAFLFTPLNCVWATEATLGPDFKLQDLNNNLVTLSSYRDKQPVLLFFWTTWCPFCRKELKALNDMYTQLVKEGIEVLSIDVGEPLAKVDKFVKSYYLVYPVLLDKDTTIAGDYKIIGVPTYFLINKKGYIVFKGNYFPRGEYKDLISE